MVIVVGSMGLVFSQLSPSNSSTPVCFNAPKTKSPGWITPSRAYALQAPERRYCLLAVHCTTAVDSLTADI